VGLTIPSSSRQREWLVPDFGLFKQVKRRESPW
jgi:hypothetical protein